MKILAIDPGPDKTGLIVWTGLSILRAEVIDNYDLLGEMRNRFPLMQSDALAIEMIASYGMAVGREVFETCTWIGRFTEAWESRRPELARYIYRRDIKLHHCQSPRAKDTNIRQALIDKYGPPGTKKEPGITYGLKSHLWAAFALATYFTETQGREVAA